MDDVLVRADLPTGTVTFLFTDIEGSTRLLHSLGPEAYAAALDQHRQVLREAFAASGGTEVDTQGDAFFVAFPTVPGALEAARCASEDLEGGPIRVRMGLHTGTPWLTDEGYVGVDVHRAARIAASGHGGQILLSAASAALVDPGLLRDLGEHRLKDLSAPERIFQLGDEEFTRLKTLHQTNLPVPATPFLGRERALDQLHPLLTGEHPRLVTLSGPGGTGKTRLALQAAADAADTYPDGVFWVPLAAVRDPQLVIPTVAQALGAGDQLAAYISDRAMLLVLDNVEQVIAAAPDLVALLTACPRLKLLATSREVLAVAGEQVYPVPPFDQAEGVGFFMARSRAAKPGFVGTAAVTELCARLDNLPLALELAAARVRIMTVDQLVERLGNRLDLLRAVRGADPRQATLRATIEWSHDLLEPEERTLFARLAVFVGGCTLEVAEEVCAADVDVLQSLVDKSLVRVRDDGRIWMLETIREYAVERLDHSAGAEHVRRRHGQYFGHLVTGDEFSATALETSVDSFVAVHVEHANLLAALDHLEHVGATQQALEMATALSSFWLVGGFVLEARNRLERALDADPAATAARAAALYGLGEALAMTGDVAGARLRAQEALALHRSLGDRRGAAESLQLLGYCHVEARELEAGRDLYEECLALLAEAPPDRLLIWAGRSLAWVRWELGELDEARRTYEAALAESRRQGNRSAEATVLGASALLAAEQGRFDDAMAGSRASMVIWRELHDPVSVGERIGGVASVLAAAGRWDEAAQALAYSRVILARVSAEGGWVERMNSATGALLGDRLDLDLAVIQDACAEATVEGALDWVIEALSTSDPDDSRRA